jgi:hypothetical protein
MSQCTLREGGGPGSRTLHYSAVLSRDAAGVEGAVTACLRGFMTARRLLQDSAVSGFARLSCAPYKSGDLVLASLVLNLGYDI